MTVDETPVSPATSGQPAKVAAGQDQQPSFQRPGCMSPHGPRQGNPPNAASPSSQQQQHLQPVQNHEQPMHRKQPQTQNTTDPNSFEAFANLHPNKANEMMGMLVEVTGVRDKKLLFHAFNISRKTAEAEFNVEVAIDWLLAFNAQNSQEAHSQSSQDRNQSSAQKKRGPPSLTGISPVPATAGQVPMQPPNSPTLTAGPTLASPPKPLVDLTDQPNSNNAKEMVDTDLEKAIKLSLQEAAAANNATGGNAGTGFGVSQEEQDVSRALEASLLDNQIVGNPRRGLDNWIDPLNPHDRKRNGMWPVGLKNVGQTCWFSAVIQSLFYLPAFRSLVLNFTPESRELPSLPDIESEKKILETEGKCSNENRLKIVEFMKELRKLFALMVASQRRYVDPSKAVDILRGSTRFGSLQQSKDFFGVEANNQQDVSEFTHIVLEWVEDAFKKVTKDKDEQMMEADCEKENNEEKEVPGEEQPLRQKVSPGDENPMSKLFYGKVLTEGVIRGEPFVREDFFGQWPLQVNTFNDIHESLENSTAHESFDSVGGGNTSVAGPATPVLDGNEPQPPTTPLQQQPLSGQERWFQELPPVLFFELSRFQYNTERKTAEKIHNRLEFPERIYMDRYVAENKSVTRKKREEVRSLKEKRALLKARLDKFLHYGMSDATREGGSETSKGMPLPLILESTLAFASASAQSHLIGDGTPVVNAVSSVAAATLMQVDSPCGSPRVTPASSLANLSVPNNACASEAADGDDDTPMDVEMSPEKENSCVSSEPNEAGAVVSNSLGCDSIGKGGVLSPVSSQKMAMSQVANPSPRHVTEAEIHVLQNCLTRWKQEVEQDMLGLRSAIQTIESQIETMYNEDFLRKLEYQLHAVMVHEGSIDSGHYWAYVLDHKRKVWLKFNDNTVNEASWDELAKESMGGHSNTSAYSLVYIDNSKPELLMDAEWACSIGETKEEQMDQGELEALAITLPEDLAEFVVEDNEKFRNEITQWDKDQEQKRQQQQTHVEGQEADTSVVSSACDSNEVQVVQEKLTYVNNHARLSMDATYKLINRFELELRQNGPSSAVLQALQCAEDHYNSTVQAIVDPVPSKPELLPRQDRRLESFIYYLLRNAEAKNKDLIELAILEQFAFPGLENNTPTITAFRNAAESHLVQRRKSHPQEAASLRQWHQAYHLFRRSAHCFVAGLDAHSQQKVHEAVDLFTEAYNYSQKVAEVPVAGSFKTVKLTLILRYLCKVLPESNRALTCQFVGQCENLNEVVNAVQTLIVPVLGILQARMNRDTTARSNQAHQGIEAKTIEEIRDAWCGLLGDANVSPQATTVISDIIPMILEPEVSSSTGSGKPQQTSKNRDSVDLHADLTLANRYTEVVNVHIQMQASMRGPGGSGKGNSPSSQGQQQQQPQQSQQQQQHHRHPQQQQQQLEP